MTMLLRALLAFLALSAPAWAGPQTPELVPFSTTEGLRATYRAATNAGFATAASATDIAAISGSATTVVRVTHAALSCVQTTAGNQFVQLIKRSGGSTQTAPTTTNMPVMKADSSDAAATAVTGYYTANPTAATTAGSAAAKLAFIPAPATAAGEVALRYDLLPNTKPVVLRGATQWLAFNLGAATLTGGSCVAEFEWTESTQ